MTASNVHFLVVHVQQKHFTCVLHLWLLLWSHQKLSWRRLKTSIQQIQNLLSKNIIYRLPNKHSAETTGNLFCSLKFVVLGLEKAVNVFRSFLWTPYRRLESAQIRLTVWNQRPRAHWMRRTRRSDSRRKKQCKCLHTTAMVRHQFGHYDVTVIEFLGFPLFSSIL